jgi:hypothetical protein
MGPMGTGICGHHISYLCTFVKYLLGGLGPITSCKVHTVSKYIEQKLWLPAPRVVQSWRQLLCPSQRSPPRRPPLARAPVASYIFLHGSSTSRTSTFTSWSSSVLSLVLLFWLLELRFNLVWFGFVFCFCVSGGSFCSTSS